MYDFCFVFLPVMLTVVFLGLRVHHHYQRPPTTTSDHHNRRRRGPKRLFTVVWAIGIFFSFCKLTYVFFLSQIRLFFLLAHHERDCDHDPLDASKRHHHQHLDASSHHRNGGSNSSTSTSRRSSSSRGSRRVGILFWFFSFSFSVN
jgi:hypothetical protein